MTWQGTAMYDDFASQHHVPERVLRAVELSKQFDFVFSTHPHTGRLLASLAAGVVSGVIGETGTGTGVGLAWMHEAAPSDTRLVSVEIDRDRAEATAELFADCPNVTVITGEADELGDHAPFDMLVLDAPSASGPLNSLELDPLVQLTENGLLFSDDQWPMTAWPPTKFDGELCQLRPHWFDHPALFTTEVRVADGYAAVLARRRPPGARLSGSGNTA